MYDDNERTTKNKYFCIGQNYNILIDGGDGNDKLKRRHLSNIEKCMKEYGVMTEHDVQLDCIVVTHPDADHMNGIKKLLKKHGRKILNGCDMVITRAFYWTSRTKECEKFMELIDRAYPKRYDIEVKKCLRPAAGLNCHFPTEMGCLLPRGDDLQVRCTQQSETYRKPKGADTNETSILTVINESKRKCDVVLTGDSNAKEILRLVEEKEIIRIFQVPHHGSSDNSSLRLEDSIKLEEISRSYDLSAIHDKKIKETFLFYSTFRAECYLISAGGTGNYKHPHPEVMQGIILANAWKNQECVILLTNSRGLDSEKLGQLHQLVPEWTKYVKIYHYDDVFLTDQCHTMLHPERCISDVRTNTVEWTPEEYINRTKNVLPVEPMTTKSRPPEWNRFTDQSTVKISIQGMSPFNAHIICIPLPHNPRSGDNINCCYVIKESIAFGVDLSKALFLLNGDKPLPLSRARKYILIQYISNEWQKKQLPATLTEIPYQTSPCNIPYDDINENFLHYAFQLPELRVMPGNEVRSPSRPCKCKTGCDTLRCGCNKQGLPCGPGCKCNSTYFNCENT